MVEWGASGRSNWARVRAKRPQVQKAHSSRLRVNLSYRSPVHVFCEDCAVRHWQKSGAGLGFGLLGGLSGYGLIDLEIGHL
jgi:hypothetical protein